MKGITRKKAKQTFNRKTSAQRTMYSEADIDEWYFVQVKGKVNENDVVDADVITSVVFNHDGSLLATGDRGGRVVIFYRNENAHDVRNRDDYNVYATFQSHEPDFDYLKSLDIEEKINKICWLQPCNNSSFMLTTNDKTIKLFKINEKQSTTNHRLQSTTSCSSSRPHSVQETFEDGGAVLNHHVEDCSFSPSSPSVQQTKLLRRQFTKSSHVRSAHCRRVYSNAHTFNIHSVTTSHDRDYFLSADDLRINLWNIDRNDTCFTIVDIKPENMEDLSEVITCNIFHPSNDSLFLYSSSRGCVRLCDTRMRSLCDSPASVFDYVEDDCAPARFSEVIRSVSDLQFSNDSRHFLTRDYFSIKVWDIHMPKAPIETHQVHEYLSSEARIIQLYETEAIFDRFECKWSPDTKRILSGSYGNLFSITRRGDDRNTSKTSLFEAAYDYTYPLNNQRTPIPIKTFINTDNKKEGASKKRNKDSISIEDIQFSRKVGSLDWHPRDNIIALAATNNLYVFNQKKYYG